MKKVDDQAISDFLDGKDTEVDEQALDDFLEGKEDPNVPMREQRQSRVAERRRQANQVVGDTTLEDMWVGVNQLAGSANSHLLNAFGLPGDAFNWVAEKLGSEGRTYGSDQLREIGANNDFAYPTGKIPDTPAAKSGEYMSHGLLFLAPFLKMGQTVKAVKDTSTLTGKVFTTKPGTQGGYNLPRPTTKNPANLAKYSGVEPTAGVFKGLSQQMTKPFVHGKSAGVVPLAAELGVSGISGLGAHMGKEIAGPEGEMVGGVLAPLPFILTPALAPILIDKGKRVFFPMTPSGAKAKAGKRLRDLSESEHVLRDIKQSRSKVLTSARDKIPPAQHSGDKHLIALQQKLLQDNPELAKKFEIDAAAVNKTAVDEMMKLGKEGSIANTTAWFKGKLSHTKELINRSVDLALENAQKALSKVSPVEQRSQVNTVVRKHLDDAWKNAKAIEDDAWSVVDKTIGATTPNTRNTWLKLLAEREATDLTEDLPSVLFKHFGDIDHTTGKHVYGAIKGRSNIGELQASRRSLGVILSKELAKKSGKRNNNKIRILGELRNALLKDMEKSKGGRKLTNAIEISKTNRDKFGGDILDNIYGHSSTGGYLQPESTVETIKGGMAAVQSIRKIMEVSPASHGMLEELVKLNMTQSSVINTKGTLNIGIAKRYLDKNKELLDMFPDTRESLKEAIKLAEVAIKAGESGKRQLAGLKDSTLALVAKATPERTTRSVLHSANPEAEMAKVLDLAKGSKKALAGIKKDAIDYLLGKASTRSVDEHGDTIVSGRKLLGLWKNNKGVLKQAFNDAELKRIDSIIETLIKNELPRHLPEVGKPIPDPNKLITVAAAVIGAQAGGRFAKHSPGGSIQTAGRFSAGMQNLAKVLDSTMAKQLLVDAIQDPVLYKALYLDTTKPKNALVANQIIDSWLLAHSISTLVENHDRFSTSKVVVDGEEEGQEVDENNSRSSSKGGLGE